MEEQFGSMEHTFITIHNLSPDANILFVSASVTEILGWNPEEVQNRPCFDYFHPDEEPWARRVHGRGVRLDKAASLHYLRIQHRDGRWISCECCFTVVHNVLVACTSIYRINAKSERRAIEAPQIRRIFSSSPRDPRYHMLEHLSPKFRMPPVEREPRAALILNRFTRPLPIMFATDAVASVLGLRPDQLQNKSFYECIRENCVTDAIRCLESAKSNDSIAYLRFWFRDPRTLQDLGPEEARDLGDVDGVEGEGSPSSSDMDSDGGVQLSSPMDIDGDTRIKTEPMSPEPLRYVQPLNGEGSSSDDVAGSANGHQEAAPSPPRVLHQQSGQNGQNGNRRRHEPIQSFELEAVVSCTSDGLVVILRRARPAIPSVYSPSVPLSTPNGVFAAPWGEQPIQPYYPPEQYHQFRAPLLPQHMPLQEHARAAGGPPIDHLMASIRDVAVFAWALCGINGNLAGYSRGVPQGEAQPPSGLPVWDPSGGRTSYLGPENQAKYRWLHHPSMNYKEKGSSTTNHPYIPRPVAGPFHHYSSTYGGSNHSNQHYPRSSWGQGDGYTHVPPPQPLYAQPHYPAQMAPRYQVHPGQNPWGEAAAVSGAQYQNGEPPVPPTQGPNPRDERPDYRHMWQ